MKDAIEVLRVAAQDAEQMSEWPDRKERFGSSLKARAEEMREAANRLTDMETTMECDHPNGVCVTTPDDRVPRAGRDHRRDVTDSVVTCIEELLRTTFYQEGIVQARETEMADALEDREQLEEQIRNLRDDNKELMLLVRDRVAVIRRADEEVMNASSVMLDLFKAMDRKAVGKSSRVAVLAKEAQNRLVNFHNTLASIVI